MATKKTAEVTTEETKAATKAKKEPTIIASSPKRIMIHINRIPGVKEQEDVIIAVNGERFQIQRGVDVEVPERVAEAFKLWQRECADAEKIEFELMNG